MSDNVVRLPQAVTQRVERREAARSGWRRRKEYEAFAAKHGLAAKCPKSDPVYLAESILRWASTAKWFDEQGLLSLAKSLLSDVDRPADRVDNPGDAPHG
jgi:hypothetical protein